MAQAPLDDTSNKNDTQQVSHISQPGLNSTDAASTNGTQQDSQLSQVSQPGRAHDAAANNNSDNNNSNNDNNPTMVPVDPNGNGNNNSDNNNDNANPAAAANAADVPANDPNAAPAAAADANANADDTDEKAKDLPPKTDITLTLKGTAEYHAFPHTKESNKFYFMASVKASYFKEKDRAPIDLCCVIDESGSMGGPRIELVKETVSFVLKNLTDQDRFGIVGYGSAAHVRLQLTKMDQAGKKVAEQVVKNIRAQGQTALCQGLEYGVKMMRNRNKDECNQIASVMLFTDGVANVGVTSAKDIQKHIEKSAPSMQNANKMQLGRTNLSVIQQQTASNPASTNNANNNNNTDHNNDNDEKTKDATKDQDKDTDEGNIDTSLPCTINTFGFGENHNEKLLEALAEWGRGMYTFIENTSTIAETFAECLGGLVSIVGRNLKIRVLGLNDVKLLRCVSQGGYKVEQIKPKQEYLITIPDIQSEENRDLVFEVSLPKLAEKRDAWPMAQIACEYHNVPKNKKDILSVIATIDRCGDNDEIGERNDELDAQCNRLIASEAMDVADKMAEKGDLANARKVLSEAKSKIQNSQTYVQQKKGYYGYAKNLASDIDDVTRDLSSRESYRSQGGKKLKMSKKAHAMQRSVHSSQYASQDSYNTSSRRHMVSKFSHK